MYKNNEPYTSIMYVLNPTVIREKGVEKKVYPECKDGIKISCLFKTYGGTTSVQSSEKEVQDIMLVVDTAVIETWYNENITSKSRIAFDDDNVYEILGSPENISNRNRTLKIKLRKYKGGA